MGKQPKNNQTDASPVPPEKPLPMDCCESGCDVCVFDAYVDALAAYEKELADWLQGDSD